MNYDDTLMHYGVKRRSGRYPWGSGETPYQHEAGFLGRLRELREQGMTDAEVAEKMNIESSTDLRTFESIAKHNLRRKEVEQAQTLRAEGKSLNEIARIMGYKNDSSVRSLLDPKVASNKDQARATVDILKKEIKTKGMLDVGAGVEKELGISRTKMEEALTILAADDGYKIYGVRVPQATNPKNNTTVEVLCTPDISYKDVYDNIGGIQSVKDYYSKDGGETFISAKPKYPASIDSNRIAIRYGDEGGTNKDGVIELRRGVADLDLGGSHYAQVRILVDGTHYLKGMAMYSDDMPCGSDIVFNTNKKTGTPKMDVLKPIKDDPDNPFGAYFDAKGQSEYTDKDGKTKLSAINKLKAEGDWDTMSRTLSQQFLSKQPLSLIKKQLKLTYADAEAEYDEIKSLNNPTIKRKMLLDFANECDAKVVHLKAAALPRQKTQVILPITGLKETEVYAPNYETGEKVALIRYPHAGTFEIPILTVNNRNKSARSILGPNITDAIGINEKVAERLSGADFDGDYVTVIPTNDKVKITSTRPLEGLKNFNAKDEYPERAGMKHMTKAGTQREMGMISNLITDMTLGGAKEPELVRAVKHSMVVIDAEKHHLDYKKSEKDNRIDELRKKYQMRVDENGEIKYGGASTLLSRRKQDVQVPERRGSGIINKETGEVEYKTSGRTYVDKTGKIVPATTTVKLMNETKDIRTLSSGTAQENAYADYANKMKALANTARKEYTTTGRLKYNKDARTEYKAEADRLIAALNTASKNAPRERRAQVIAYDIVESKKKNNPELDKDKKELKKTRQMAITSARDEVGAHSKDTRITISDREWEAIQKGAISDTQLTQILRYADADSLRQRATPRATTQLSPAKVSKIKSMMASGYTNAEIAKAMGISTSTVSKYGNA